METILGLLGVAAYIVGVILLAAAVTWAVVKISPAKDGSEKPKPSEQT